jgi:hypothetical protein
VTQFKPRLVNSCGGKPACAPYSCNQHLFHSIETDDIHTMNTGSIDMSHNDILIPKGIISTLHRCSSASLFNRPIVLRLRARIPVLELAQKYRVLFDGH